MASTSPYQAPTLIALEAPEPIPGRESPFAENGKRRVSRVSFPAPLNEPSTTGISKQRQARATYSTPGHSIRRDGLDEEKAPHAAELEEEPGLELGTEVRRVGVTC